MRQYVYHIIDNKLLMVPSNKDGGGGRLRHTQKIHGERLERFIYILNWWIF
jgi:hypothetical protein